MIGLIGKRILKIVSEIAEIIEVMLAPVIMKLTLCYYREREKKFYIAGGNFDLNYLSDF